MQLAGKAAVLLSGRTLALIVCILLTTSAARSRAADVRERQRNGTVLLLPAPRLLAVAVPALPAAAGHLHLVPTDAVQAVAGIAAAAAAAADCRCRVPLSPPPLCRPSSPTSSALSKHGSGEGQAGERQGGAVRPGTLGGLEQSLAAPAARSSWALRGDCSPGSRAD